MRRSGQRLGLPTGTGRCVTWGIGTTVATIFAAYPALWVAPRHEISKIYGSATMAGQGHRQFFRGDVVETPGPLYYLFALPLRLTPWLLAAGLVALVAVWCRRTTRPLGLTLACMTGPPFVILSLASKQFDRYGLILIALTAILVGIVAAPWLPRLPRVPPVTALGALALLVGIHSAAVAPWGLAYFNPALGGGDVAEKVILVGWGEGIEQADRLIREREGGHCRDVTYRGLLLARPSACGTRVDRADDAGYVIVYINQRQRAADAEVTSWTEGRSLVGVVTIRGITYAEVWA